MHEQQNHPFGQGLEPLPDELREDGSGIAKRDVMREAAERNQAALGEKYPILMAPVYLNLRERQKQVDQREESEQDGASD